MTPEEKTKRALQVVKATRIDMGRSLASMVAYMEQNKIKGEQGDAERCPLAMTYLKALRPIFRNKKLEVCVDGDTIEITVAGEQVLSIPATALEKRFIDKFDDADDEGNVTYPQLMKVHR